jgi:site-specific DNA-adenine methylase
MQLTPPITYQGGKQRLAARILDRINPPRDADFYDLCCGSGAISIALVNRGHPPNKIWMVDQGPWGLFWKMVGDGTFDVNKFAEYCGAIPEDRHQIKPHMQTWFKEPIGDDSIYRFLLMQASTFGGAAVWMKEKQWQKSGGFRDYWQPTETSKRRSPVNPMMPLPNPLLARVKAICEGMLGVKGYHGSIHDIRPTSGIVYIDPDYQGTASYGYNADVMEYVKNVKVKCYVSEGVPLSKTAHQLSGGERKGGMSGSRAKAHEEWLSEFN